jgi:hypothetical protein
MSNYDAEQPVRATSTDFQTGIADSADVRINPAKEDGHLATIDTKTTSIDGKLNSLGQKAMAASVPVVLASDQSSIPVSFSGTSATNLTQVGGAAVALGQTTKSASLPVTLASDQGNLPANITQVGGASLSEGQKTMAASVPVVLASDQTDLPVNEKSINGTAIATNTGNANGGTQRVVIASDQPAIPVTFTAGQGDEKATYNTSVNLAAGASVTHSYNPGATEVLDRIVVCGSGQLFVTIQYGPTGSETTKEIGFTSASNKNYQFVVPGGIAIPNTQTIKVIIKNEDHQAFDVFSTIWTNP